EVEPLLRDLVGTRSVFPEEQDLAVMLATWLRERGFAVDRVPVGDDRFNLVADRGDPDIAFYGHMDTVPVQGDWTRDPLDP
ncbi:MAG: M20 family peptidase, partial [Candidatus Nanohaloarchaea archaeon]